MESEELKQKRVVIGMSGGVDSSVAAALLLEEGYEVIGVFMKLWTDPDQEIQENTEITVVENKCCSLDSHNDADRVAAKLGIPLYTINFRDPFKTIVVDPFLVELAKGRTPNPCIWCNQTVRFDLLFKQSKKLGADYVATGHYAQKVERAGEASLKKGVDTIKDQSYFLHTLKQAVLKDLLFPVGHMTKDQVRAEATKRDLYTKSKHESQGLCFTAGKNHTDFVKKYLPLEPGKIISEKGVVLGDHLGLPLYTLGQRAPVGGPDGPWFITKKDSETNSIFVTNDPRDPKLFSKEILIDDVNWISNSPPEPGSEFKIKVRHGHVPIPGTIEPLKSGQCRVTFHVPIRAVTPGQSAVCYDKDTVIGGGVIVSTTSVTSESSQKNTYANALI